MRFVTAALAARFTEIKRRPNKATDAWAVGAING